MIPEPSESNKLNEFMEQSKLILNWKLRIDAYSEFKLTNFNQSSNDFIDRLENFHIFINICYLICLNDQQISGFNWKLDRYLVQCWSMIKI